jgi:hypothetical protein
MMRALAAEDIRISIEGRLTKTEWRWWSDPVPGRISPPAVVLRHSRRIDITWSC